MTENTTAGKNRNNYQRIFKLLSILGLLLFFGNAVRAQCGPDGTQPCGKIKPKIAKNKSNKSSQGTSKTSETTPPVNSNFLYNRLLGTWKTDEEDASRQAFLTFSPQGTAALFAQGKVCLRFTFVLKEDIVYLTVKSNYKCPGVDAAVNSKSRMKIQFDAENRLGTTLLKPDGTRDTSTTWSTKIK